MFKFYRAAVAAVAASLLISGSAMAGTVTYSSQASFLAAVGSYITDDYSNPGYLKSFGGPPNIMTDAYMSSVLHETQYVATKWSNANLVVGSPAQPFYCTGCNGSFDLIFKTTSLSTGGGVYGVSFNYRNGFPRTTDTGFDFFVTFADGSSWDFVPPLSTSTLPNDFFGITSDLQIADIYIGDHHTPSSNTRFLLDNLTIAAAKAPARVPEPLSLGMFGAGLAGLAALRRRKWA
ncbi:MAG TPA: PEP-CTERM sorting domain-containing protein [Rhizomicrobium sp.]|nr:PEP-CTERM sorting domain-containing protein [Rhizomicrobium sp.]